MLIVWRIIAVADALARGFSLRRSYWLPMTVAMVLRSDLAATFSRGVLRLLGTFVGLTFVILAIPRFAGQGVAPVLAIAASHLHPLGGKPLTTSSR